MTGENLEPEKNFDYQNKSQIEWYKHGSALNLIKKQNAA